ncbi:MAG TPA: glycoside hydrolase family 95 protein [Saprospiraceae bacterium]|nr:glycoside hydrolase family 95 protein [Saprospiraceae bacterium]HPI07898.1 glycoside hydrolase family 95 protein [Saprospiraceae bacterium]
MHENLAKISIFPSRSIQAGTLAMRISLFFLLMAVPFFSRAQTLPATPWNLWFEKPAADWNEALPVGNGRLGAMVFGGIETERLQLNESSVWTGGEEDFVNPAAKEVLPLVRTLLFAGRYAEAQKLAQERMMGNKPTRSRYQTLGDLYIDFGKEHTAQITDYQRFLDIDSAVAGIRYKSGGVQFSREIFSSAPGQALVMRLQADQPGALTAVFRLSRPGGFARLETNNGDIILREHVDRGHGVQLVVRLRVVQEGGLMAINDSVVQIEKADRITVFLTAATDYWKTDPESISADRMEQVSKRPYTDIKAAHIADYQQLFERVNLNLGASPSRSAPVDRRLEAVQNGSDDPELIALYYQFGRYLLISSSRPGGLPTNLQGIWADGLNPPWDADFHININIQMNYWPAEICNLPEMHLPFLQFIDSLQADGHKTARDMYNKRGTVAHFTTDAWHFTETYGETLWAMWPMGMAWSVQHFWDHYLFSGDRVFLEKRAYPVMKEAALFCADWLIANPKTKLLVSGPSISPENRFKTPNGEVSTMVMGPTMDHMIIRNLLESTIAASLILQTDDEFRARLQSVLKRLAPTRIGSDGRIMEWTEEFEEPEPGHRHISHLFGLYPGHEITPQNPELMAAARKTIDYRLAYGGGHTGWSRAWIINFFARLHDGESAYQNLLALLRKSTLPNLFDNHPPFQIDGNFGATAGITEMLLQSHAGNIEILPALPAAWKTGFIHGICARGGYEVSIDWLNGKLKRLELVSKLGEPCLLKYGEKEIALTDKTKGKRYVFDADLKLEK